MSARWWFYPVVILVSLGLVLACVVALTLILLYPTLPDLDRITDYKPKIPLRVYTADDVLIGEFGEERRAVVKIDQVPLPLRQAILAAEDDSFYQHGGVDYKGVLRATLANIGARGAKEGASTITMQVARNFFLSNERTLTRKLSEVLLAFKIERNLTKDQILELYMNQIFLGQRAYGFAAASSAYYNRPLDKLNMAEWAMLAGLPKAPSRFNPIVNPKRATERQQYVLRRMHDLKYLNDAQYAEAQKLPIKIQQEIQVFPVRAEHVAEMARQTVFEKYGDSTYTSGLKVYTTLLKKDQEAAYISLRKGVMDYDRRHGYRGAEAQVDLSKTTVKEDEEEDYDDLFQAKENNDELLPALVLEVSAKQVKAYLKGGERIIIGPEGARLAAKMIGDKATGPNRIRRGSIIRVIKDPKTNEWSITQLPQVESAFVAINPSNGSIQALVGGFDFSSNKFNHVTQAWRQPGSSFKPFIYSAALEKGITPASVFNDAPFVVPAEETGGELWEPKNYDGKYDGPLRVRQALAKSKNMVSIRVLQSIGTEYAQDYITRFGFDKKQHPAVLTLALGAGSATPLQMASAYSIFANGGYRIKPYFIQRVLDQRGNIVMEARPELAEFDAERVIDPRNAFIMTTLMRDVVRAGTATAAMKLGRNDLAGKTGTTNDHIDAWFCGFNSNLVGVSWIGFDNPTPMGANETGGQAALPMWVGYAAKALKGISETPLVQPQGVVQYTVSTFDGARLPPGTIVAGVNSGAVNDYFYAEYPPLAYVPGIIQPLPEEMKQQEEVKAQLF
jgi:penicillin-binding protein 1A